VDVVAQILRQDLRGVALPETVRRSTYELSDEAYQTIHELEEFGLIKIHDLMPGRRFGRFDRSKVDDPPGNGQFTPGRLRCGSACHRARGRRQGRLTRFVGPLMTPRRSSRTGRMAHEVGIGGDDYVCIGSAVQHPAGMVGHDPQRLTEPGASLWASTSGPEPGRGQERHIGHVDHDRPAVRFTHPSRIADRSCAAAAESTSPLQVSTTSPTRAWSMTSNSSAGVHR
jgi:hypothetical protein